MPIEVYPVPVSVTSSINANSITATAAFTLYEGMVTLDPAIYTVTCASATIAKVQFLSNTSTIITTATTASGTVSINLASAADRVRVWTDTGSNVVVTITKTASALTDIFSGTLDTITSSGTYTGTSTSGFAYAVLAGGGGGGAGGGQSNQVGGIGGGSGGVAEKLVTLTGSMAVTIGTGGAGGAYQHGAASAGGGSTFAGMTANGGGGGSAYDIAGTGGTATGGTINTTGNNGTASQTTNGGAGGVATTVFQTFVISSLSGANKNSGGNGASSYGTGTTGSPGVLYVLRF